MFGSYYLHITCSHWTYSPPLFRLSVSGLDVAGSVGFTLTELMGRPGETMPGPEQTEASQRGEEFVVADVVIRGSRSGTRFLLSFRCGMVWGGYVKLQV